MEYKYLGIILNNKGKREADITERTNKTFKIYYNNVVKKVPKQTKLQVYWRILRPILIYSYET